MRASMLFTILSLFLSASSFAKSAAKKAEPAKPQCMLHGTIKSTVMTKGGKHDSSLSDIIRMRFDADDAKKCEAMISSYCRYNILDKQDEPVNLAGSFKQGDKTIEKYGVDKNCKIKTNPDSGDED